MSDRMSLIPFGQLMHWILTEYADQQTIFGVRKIYQAPAGKKLDLFKEHLETPFGPAAGPNTQLAQNIIASYVGGARFFELKTVQILDGEDLPVAKPCITAEDECYNCEWSTELYVPQAYEEYVKAWFAIKLLCKEYALGEPDGFIFNMSVGYDLKGIQSPKIDTYIENMRDAEQTEIWKTCRDWALANLSAFQHIDKAYVESISPKVCDSITISTLHGCPPQEIESIANYLIGEKHLNTFIKCNPTLLGYEFARSTMDKLGFGSVVFDDVHFKGDLQYADAVPMFQRLQAKCDAAGLAFGVKLTNTFPVTVAAGELPSEEMYMSGRSLFPLTVSLAQQLSHEFGGKLRISYSGGADAFNIDKLFSAGIWPITLATTLLKPGGYDRLAQLATTLAGQDYKPFTGVDLAAVDALATYALADEHYRKPIKPLPNRKNDKQVPLTDCFIAPCRGGCPIGQDVPTYLRLMNEGNPEKALRVILERNPLPTITGTICPHHCMDRCTRNFYECPVDIRCVKLMAAQGLEKLVAGLKAPAAGGEKIAVIGGGPAGLSVSYFLARAGHSVTVFEKQAYLGGVVRGVIPGFRISSDAIDADVSLIKAMGVTFRTGCEITSLDELKQQGFSKIILATGAWKAGSAGLTYGDELDALEFLAAFKADAANCKLGKNVVVVGGGNTAMDTARAATRVPGVGKVTLAYRRTRRYMPADEEELDLALKDGVEFVELVAPVGLKDGTLLCNKMALGEPDASGRRSVTATEETLSIPADTVISAVGEKVDTPLYEKLGLAVDKRGKAVVNAETLESSLPGLYVAGDGRRGPATVVEAIADASAVAKAIGGVELEKYAPCNAKGDLDAAMQRHGLVQPDVLNTPQSERCLECATLCKACTEVCPNRANVYLWVDGRMQIVHIDGMCNECGNCRTFCPYNSAPYQDKFTLFWSKDAFESSENQGFLPLGGGKVMLRLSGKVQTANMADCDAPKDIIRIMEVMQEKYPHYMIQL